MRCTPPIRSVLLALALIGLVGGTHGQRAAALDVTVSFTIPQLPAVVDLNGPAAGTGYATTFTRYGAAGPAPLVDPALMTLTDPIQTTVASATVTILDPRDGAAETVAASTAGTAIAAAYDAATSRLTLTGVDTVARYQQVLRTLVYADNAAVPDTTDRHVAVVVNDGVVDSTPAISVVTVTIDHPPVAQDRTYVTVAGVAFGDLLPASDADGDPLTWEVVAPPTAGAVSLVPATGAFTYTPASGASGSDQFTFRVWDGRFWSAPATATVQVTPEQGTPAPQVVSSPPREAFIGDTLTYALYADTSALPPGADLVFRQAGASPGVTITKTGPTSATITWTVSTLPGVHQEIGILVIDPGSGTAAYQPIQVLWLPVGGGNG
jgi:hypothetical protein